MGKHEQVDLLVENFNHLVIDFPRELRDNILSFLEVDRGLLNLLQLDVNRARDEVGISKSLVQFVPLKVVDNILD